jgi:hypothetical protein
VAEENGERRRGSKSNMHNEAVRSPRTQIYYETGTSFGDSASKGVPAAI